MFDGRRRHGCAVFYRWLSGTDVDRRREQLYTCVHEIGHTLNLQHCWHESLAGPARPDALSWMNNPRGWPAGLDEFWRAFGFGFDRGELAHLRHGFRDDVIMGGPAGARPLPERDPWPRAVDEAETGLRLRVIAPRELQYGLPMTVGLALSATRTQPQAVPSVLGPRSRSVDIVIRAPGGRESVFEPLLRHCRVDEPVFLRAGDLPVRDYAFVHYGKRGFAFAEPGMYQLRARCITPEGAVVLSEPAWTEVRAPVSQADRAAETLLYGDAQGRLMSLMGSSPALAEGDDQLREFSDRHPGHPAAVVARVVRGTSAARDFKTVGPSGEVVVAPRDAPTARALLEDVFDIESLRRVASRAADESAAADAVDTALAHTRARREVPPVVDAFIRSRRHEIKAQLLQVIRG
jgi:hypothetical protein